MASTLQVVECIVAQLNVSGQVSARKMFGEYALYWGDTLFALVCDNQLYVKPTAAGRAFWPEAVEVAPYTGAKPSLLLGAQVQDREWLLTLARLTVEALPAPKAKARKQRKGS